MPDKPLRSLGSIYTPLEFAQLLTSWAVQNHRQKVLDVGVGEGVFTFAAYNRLKNLGAKAVRAQCQVYGAEIQHSAYKKFVKVAEEMGARFPNVRRANFFSVNFPHIEAVVGNPPYVRRAFINNIDRVRQSVIENNQSLNEYELSRLTDLYVYFLLKASSLLKPGGRLAVITADPWLNAGYGRTFKAYLKKHFHIEALVSLDRRIFLDASVKPVLLLATKKANISLNKSIYFLRVKNGLPVSEIQELLNAPHSEKPDVQVSKINYNKLTAEQPWNTYFKAPGICNEIATHKLMTPISNLAETRIGVQTLAKEFFVLTPEQARDKLIEPEFLEPLAQSTRCFHDPIIEEDREPTFYTFHCSKSKNELQGTNALRYIQAGERTKVQVRGKDITVVGYHSKERIKRSNRKSWYDLKTSLERRGRAAILIPRLIYRTFTVVWNRAEFVPGELFIEFLPFEPNYTDIEVFLAILSSSVTEILLRSQAQVYGGGTYNISPGQIKNVPIINVSLLSSKQKEELKRAYLLYLADKEHNRSAVDKAVYKILNFNKVMQQKLRGVLEDLLLIAISTKKPA